MKEIVLDESILDIDKWLPPEAIDQMVELICYLEKQQENEYDTSTTHGRTNSKLESNDETFIRSLNEDFEKYCKNKLSRKRH